MGTDWRETVRASLQTSRVTLDAPLRQATTLRIGGAADCLVELESEAELPILFALSARAGVPLNVLGRGSNLLVRDEGVRGIVVRLGRAFQQVRCDSEQATAQGGAALPNAMFVERCREQGLGGMEFLVAVPGSLGGAIAMNAGAHGDDTASHLVSVRVFDRVLNAVLEKPVSEIEFSYRHSPLRGQEGRVILSGIFSLRKLSDEAIQTRKQEIQSYRRETQPRDFPNCGSVFKNPPGNFAARLIEESGLKGHRIGDAQVSEKHANFIVNRGQATSADVMALIDLIQETVYERTGIRLDLEVQIF